MHFDKFKKTFFFRVMYSGALDDNSVTVAEVITALREIESGSLLKVKDCCRIPLIQMKRD